MDVPTSCLLYKFNGQGTFIVAHVVPATSGDVIPAAERYVLYCASGFPDSDMAEACYATLEEGEAMKVEGKLRNILYEINNKLIINTGGGTISIDHDAMEIKFGGSSEPFGEPKKPFVKKMLESGFEGYNVTVLS